jgi:hypothetical protein
MGQPGAIRHWRQGRAGTANNSSTGAPGLVLARGRIGNSLWHFRGRQEKLVVGLKISQSSMQQRSIIHNKIGARRVRPTATYFEPDAFAVAPAPDSQVILTTQMSFRSRNGT